MFVELQALFGVVVLLGLTLFGQGVAGVLQNGPRYGAGPRDEVRAPSVAYGRWNRTLANSLEGLALFAPLALMTFALDASTDLSRNGALLYLFARAVYVPLYVLGVPYVRSVAWGLGLTGTIMVGIAVAQDLF